MMTPARASHEVHSSAAIRVVVVTALVGLVLLLSRASSASAGDFSSLQWANGTIHLEQAWKMAPGRGAGVTICDVGTGVMVTHPDLANAIAGGLDSADPAAPTAYADDDGHGTWTAGLLVARGAQIWGVAPGATLLVAKVLDHGTGSATAIVAGMLWCIDRGATVVNLSLNLPSRPWDGFARTIAYGCSKGVDFAVAAGNKHVVAEPLDPATVKSPCLITANASDEHDQLAGFSNLAENPRSVTAPGQDIISDWSNGSVSIASGTSASAPLVAGVLALLRSQGADARTAVKIVLASARHPHGMTFTHGRNPWLGYGILDAEAACHLYEER